MDESDGEIKRLIRVGFLLPREYNMDEDLIYVALRRVPGPCICARAISKKEFFYREREKIIGGNTRKSSGKSLACDGDYTEFVQMLVEMNNGKVIPRFREDGARLVEKLEEISRSSSICDLV